MSYLSLILFTNSILTPISLSLSLFFLSLDSIRFKGLRLLDHELYIIIRVF